MKEYNKRIFDAKYRWQIWTAQELKQTMENTPRFWDDSNITEEERTEIIWFCGVEVHEYSLVLALYGTRADQVYLGPISQFEPTACGYIQLEQVMGGFNIRRFLMETSGIFHFQVKWELEERFPHAQVIVMNAWNLAQFIKRVRKSDRVDAIKLAQIARYDELLRISYCPSRDQAYLRELTRQRIHLIEESVRFKNRVKKLFAMYGFRWAFKYQSQWEITLIMAFLQTDEDFGTYIAKDVKLSLKDRETLMVWATFNPPPHVRAFLLFEFHQISIRSAEIELIEANITYQVQQRPDLDRKVKSLETVPGLGLMNSIAILTEIGDIVRFSTPGKLVVYCGIGPVGGTSGAPLLGSPEEKQVEKDHPNRKCNPVLKTIFTQASMVILRLARHGNLATDLTRYASKFAAQSEKRIKYRFKVAAKLIRQVYHCLKMDEQFNDQGDTTRQQNPKLTSHKSRIQAKIRKLMHNNEESSQIWDRIFTHLTAMGLNSKQLRTLRKSCIIPGGEE